MNASNNVNAGDNNDSTTEDIENSGNSVFGWVLIVIIILAVVVLISAGFRSCKKNKPLELENKTIIIPAHQIIEHKIVYFNSKGWTHIDVPYGVKKIFFSDATVRYCAKNRNENYNFCSTGTEDLSTNFSGPPKDNLEYWFKAEDNDQSGSITVNFII